MNALFTRWLPAVTLAAWGVAIVALAPAGLLAREYQIYAFVAAGVLVAGALVLAFSRSGAACCADAACGHGLSRSKTGKLLTFAVVALPIGISPFASKSALDKLRAQNCEAARDYGSVSPAARAEYEKKQAAKKLQVATTSEREPASGDSPLSQHAAKLLPPPALPLPSKDGSQPPAVTPTSPNPAEEKKVADYLVRTPDGEIIAEVLDFLYAAQDNLLRADFEGKRVQLTAQFMPDTSSNSSGNRFKGVRMFMTCCAADARPVATLIEADTPPLFPEMTWVKIHGIATFPIEKGRRIAVLKATTVEKTEPPEDSMVY